MIVAALIAATLGCLVMWPDRPHVALAPVCAASAVWAVSRASPRWVALGLLALVLCVESPQDNPAAGMWKSPLYPLGELLYRNIGGMLGVPAPFAAFELLVLLTAGALLWRRMDPKLGLPRRPVAWGLYGVLGAYALVMGVWFGFGMARGGSFQGAYWQIRQLMLLPAFALIFCEALRGSRQELAALGAVVVGSACFKGVLGAYFFYGVARPQGLEPAYVTTHPDSVLFVGAALIVIAWLLQRPTFAGLATGFVVLSWLLFSIHLNDRRIAWAELALGLLAVMALMPKGDARRRAVRVGLLLAPLLAVYWAAGTQSSSKLFAPVHAMVSVDGEQDSSTFAREVENYNVARTIESSPLWGQGFGHEYDEVVKNEIWRSFDLYKFIPHNSVYTLLMATGLLGFFFLWLPLPTAAFFAARALQQPLSARESTAALCAVGFVLLFGMQAWGDMGTQSYLPVMLLALSLATSARVALNAGAWPAAHVVTPARPHAAPGGAPPLEVS